MQQPLVVLNVPDRFPSGTQSVAVLIV